MSGGGPRGLLELACRMGIAPSYVDLRGITHQASPPTLQAVIAAMGLAADDEQAVADSIRAHDQGRWSALVEPTTVCWVGDGPSVVLRRPLAVATGVVEIVLELEQGGTERHVVPEEGFVELERSTVEGVDHVAQRVRLDRVLPIGAHRVHAFDGTRTGTGLLLVAPRRAPSPGRGWGVFAPLYGLRRSGSDRPADLGDLGALADWVADLGGRLVATLPLLATFDGEVSPYLPVSRLAWNERLLHLTDLPEWVSDAPPGTTEGDLIDPQADACRSRAALRAAAAALSPARRAELDRFIEARPHLDELARWRAAVDATGPVPVGRPLPAVDPAHVLAHRYGQWAMETQMGALHDRLDRRGVALNLDLPLGVHGQGFDVWHAPSLFTPGASVGAPPDDFFTGGQNWGFPPLLPTASRASGHEYLRSALAHQFRHAGVVRVDHVMGLHRLWWVPSGAAATEGAYVHYPAEELAALVTLEAARAGTAVVGENLGTVPPEVGDLLREHNLIGMYATQFELLDAPHARPPTPDTFAVVNTHDMAPFAAFWEEADPGLRDRIFDQLGRDGQGASGEDPLEVLEALLGWLGQSEAIAVVVTLEDLWGELRPQNRPGTGPEEPNWRRRMTRTLEEIRADGDLVARLGRLRAARSEVRP